MVANEWLVLGISGITCGGKTTLAEALRSYFVELHSRCASLWHSPYVVGDVRLLSQDDYFLPVSDARHVHVKQLNAINFELISSLDMKKMLSDIAVIMKDRDGDSTVISDANNTKRSCLEMDGQSRLQRGPASSTAAAAAAQRTLNVLIIEGFTIFNVERMHAICNLKFHMHLPYEKCYERRRQRTYDPPDVPGYFETCVWPHYEQNYETCQQYSDGDIVLLNGESSRERIFHYVLQHINAYVQNNSSYGIYPPAPKKLLSAIKDYYSELNSQIQLGNAMK